MTSMLSSQGYCASWGQETGGCLSGSWCSQALNRCQGKLSSAFPPPLASHILSKGRELSTAELFVQTRQDPQQQHSGCRRGCTDLFLGTSPRLQPDRSQGEGSGCGRGSRPQKQMACLAPSPERRGHPGNHLEPEIKEPEAPSFSESVSSHWVAWCFLPSKTELALLPFPNGSGGLDLLSLCLSACEVEPSLPPPTSDGTAGKGATDMQPESLGSGSVLPTACS